MPRAFMFLSGSLQMLGRSGTGSVTPRFRTQRPARRMHPHGRPHPPGKGHQALPSIASDRYERGRLG